MKAVDSFAWAPALVVVPLVLALLAVVLPGRGWQRSIAVLGVLLVPLCGVGLALQVWRVGPLRHAVGGWGAPLGIELYADGLSCLMLLMTAAVAGVTSLHGLALTGSAAAGRSERSGGGLFWPLWLLLWAGLNALFLSGDLFNLYVTLEVIGLSSVALIAIEGKRTALAASLQYLLLTLLGSLTYLLGVALVYGAYGILDLAGLAGLEHSRWVDGTALGLIVGGLLLKVGLVPLHFWLPPAHSSAPAPVSAVLSGLVIKAPYYVLIRVWFVASPEASESAARWLLAGLGAVAILWGSIQALRQVRLKLLVAYSTVAQLGYLFLLFPLAAGDSAAALVVGSAFSGTIYVAISHACAKAAMFLSAGTMLHWAGHDSIPQLRGVGQQLPISIFAFGIAGASLMGVPPSGGFMGKWLLLDACLRQGRWELAGVILIGGLLTAAYLFRVLSLAFADLPDGAVGRATVSPWLELPALALALAALVLGVTSRGPIALLEVGPFWRPAAAEVLR